MELLVWHISRFWNANRVLGGTWRANLLPRSHYCSFLHDPFHHESRYHDVRHAIRSETPELINIDFSIYSADSLSEEVINYPNVIIQFLFYIYHNAPDYMTVFMTPDVLSSMVAALFPNTSSSEASSECNTPVDDFKVRSIIALPFNSEINFPPCISFSLFWNRPKRRP